MSAPGGGLDPGDALPAPGDTAAMVAPVGPARLPLRRLRAGARAGTSWRHRLFDVYLWGLLAVIAAAIAVSAAKPLLRLLIEPGSAPSRSPGRLFVTAAALLLLGGLVYLLRAAGPISASAAFRFWLLTAPVSRRALLRRRFVTLIAAVAVLSIVIVAAIAHAVAVAVLPVLAGTGLTAVMVTSVAVWGQASEAADRMVQLIGRSVSATSVLGFGSLATGAGRTGLDQALRAPPDAVAAALAVLALAAAASVWLAYRALDRVDLSALRSGHGVWAAGRAAAMSLDVFMVADSLTERRARAVGWVRSAMVGPRFGLALLRTEWARVRRRPDLLARAAIAGVVWWGCRPVLPGPALSAVAVVGGYLLVLPFAAPLRQLAVSASLRAQFAPQDRLMAWAAASACLLAAAAWTAIVLPGFAASDKAVLAVIIAVGVTAAACRTVTRPPLDYSKPPLPTPFGDFPLDLWRQLARGPFLLAVVVIIAAVIAH
jgi:hypothetical protein